MSTGDVKVAKTSFDFLVKAISHFQKKQQNTPQAPEWARPVSSLVDMAHTEFKKLIGKSKESKEDAIGLLLSRPLHGNELALILDVHIIGEAASNCKQIAASESYSDLYCVLERVTLDVTYGTNTMKAKVSSLRY